MVTMIQDTSINRMVIMTITKVGFRVAFYYKTLIESPLQDMAMILTKVCPRDNKYFLIYFLLYRIWA